MPLRYFNEEEAGALLAFCEACEEALGEALIGGWRVTRDPGGATLFEVKTAGTVLTGRGATMGAALKEISGSLIVSLQKGLTGAEDKASN
jgi:hypothetical protein